MKIIFLAFSLLLMLSLPKADAAEKPFKGFVVSEARPSSIDESKIKSIKSQMTFGEIVAIFGPGWMSPNEGVGIMKWFFKDGTKLSVWLASGKYVPDEMVELQKDGTKGKDIDASWMWLDLPPKPVQ